MKTKIIFIFFILLNFSINAQTSKSCDLSLELIAPYDGQVLPFGDTLDCQMKIKNHGPDDLTISDTVFYTISDVSYVFFTVNEIPNGDSVIVEGIRLFSTEEDDLPLDFCFTIENELAYGYVDTNNLNNSDCASFTMKGSDATALEDVLTAGLNIVPHPNPFSSTLKISGLENHKYSLTVADVFGRIYFKFVGFPEELNNHLSSKASSLSAGVFILHLINQSNSQSQTFKVVKTDY